MASSTPGPLIVSIEEGDYHSAAQSVDRDQVFGFLAMLGEEVSLNVTRTGPLETAEEAFPRSLVYVLLVPCELLGTPEALVAIGTDSPHIAVYVTTAAVLPVSALNSYMPSWTGFVGTTGSLAYVSSGHGKPGKPGDAHLVGRLGQLGL